jgi:hypothetical protein
MTTLHFVSFSTVDDGEIEEETKKAVLRKWRRKMPFWDRGPENDLRNEPQGDTPAPRAFLVRPRSLLSPAWAARKISTGSNSVSLVPKEHTQLTALGPWRSWEGFEKGRRGAP